MIHSFHNNSLSIFNKTDDSNFTPGSGHLRGLAALPDSEAKEAKRQKAPAQNF
jgi:hypothetical protein